MNGIVLIDAPPVWSATIARLMAECDVILTPLEPDFLGMQGFNRLLQTMKRHGAPWGRLRILICRYVDRLAIHREVRERLGQLFTRGTLLPVVIRNSVRLAEAPGFGRAHFRSCAGKLGACDYEAAARLLLGEWRMTTTNAHRVAGRRACLEARRGAMATKNRLGRPGGGRLPNDPLDWVADSASAEAPAVEEVERLNDAPEARLKQITEG